MEYYTVITRNEVNLYDQIQKETEKEQSVKMYNTMFFELEANIWIQYLACNNFFGKIDTKLHSALPLGKKTGMKEGKRKRCAFHFTCFCN